MAPTVYLVSGANRGIGLALVQHLIVRENVVIFAGVRDPDSATALKELASQYQSKLHIIKLISADEANNREAVEQIKHTAGRLDVVIANAAILQDPKFVLDQTLESMKNHFHVNVLGPMALIQATYPLLKASTSTPKFIPISSMSGSITMGTQFPMPQTEYGTSKAALNWMTKKLWTENEGLITFPLSPGMVETDMSRTAAADPKVQELLKQMGAHAQKVEDASKLVLQQIDAATRETSSLMSHEGKVIPW